MFMIFILFLILLCDFKVLLLRLLSIRSVFYCVWSFRSTICVFLDDFVEPLIL